jgi:hypothetical protein
MEITVPWEAFLALIEPVHHKPSSKGGRPPIPLEVMLRIHLLQLSGDNEVGRSATSSLAGWVSGGDPGADAQGPGDAGTTDEPPTQLVYGETTRWQKPGGCCRSGGHLSA